jgi:cupin fold WbuC family metalloprotein
MQLINTPLLDTITAQAKQSPRLRMNHNFHESPESKSQRLLNAMEPDTIMPIHRHLQSDETQILLRGKIEVTAYNDKKEVTERYILGSATGNYGVNIPKGQKFPYLYPTK